MTLPSPVSRPLRVMDSGPAVTSTQGRKVPTARMIASPMPVHAEMGQGEERTGVGAGSVAGEGSALIDRAR